MRWRKLAPHVTCSLQIVRSLGDESPATPIDRFGAEGVFARALEHALQDDVVDVAVHSAKDLPSTLPIVSRSRRLQSVRIHAIVSCRETASAWEIFRARRP